MNEARNLGTLGYQLPNAIEGPALYVAPSVLGADFVDFIIDGKHRVVVHKKALSQAITGVLNLTSTDIITLGGMGHA